MPVEGQGVKYMVDIVLCIDATGSMRSIIERVKAAAVRFPDDLDKEMRSWSKSIDSLRIKVIAFRDYFADGTAAMVESKFFQFPSDRDEFAGFVKKVTATGGGDEPENGLEALVLAIRSDWTKTGEKRRHIISVFTDTSAHPLEKGVTEKPVGYLADGPKNLNELTNMWEGQSYMEGNARRLLLFAPDADPWSRIANEWENTIQHASKAGEGLSDIDYKTILSVIARSV